MKNTTNENLQAGDVVTVRIYHAGFTKEREAILTERFRDGWILEVEHGDKGLTTSYSPDGDPRLDYRLLGHPA